MIRFLVYLMLHDTADKLVEKGHTRREAYYIINHIIGGILGLIIIIPILFSSLSSLSNTFGDMVYNYTEKQRQEERKEKYERELEEERKEWEEHLKELYGEDWMEMSGYKPYIKKEEPKEWYLRKEGEVYKREEKEWDSKSSPF